MTFGRFLQFGHKREYSRDALGNSTSSLQWHTPLGIGEDEAQSRQPRNRLLFLSP
jgi:hypothetical protein